MKPSYQRLKSGKSFQIPLPVDADPMPSFQWYKNGYPLSSQRGQTLIIEKLNVTHSGTYSCELKNIAGSILWLEATVLVYDDEPQ